MDVQRAGKPLKERVEAEDFLPKLASWRGMPTSVSWMLTKNVHLVRALGPDLRHERMPVSASIKIHQQRDRRRWPDLELMLSVQNRQDWLCRGVMG
eukprot:bmy_08796T0